MSEQEAILERISLAWVNGHITAQEAAQAHDALVEHWLTTPGAGTERDARDGRESEKNAIT